MKYRIVFDSYEADRYTDTLKEAKRVVYAFTMKHPKTISNVFNGERWVGYAFGDPRTKTPIWTSYSTYKPYILHKDGNISAHPYAEDDRKLLSMLKKIKWK